MNQHLAKAIEIYGDDLQQLLAWHLCYGIVVSSDEFLVNHTGAVTSGSVTAQFVAIQASGNISTVSYYDSDDDRFVLNFQNEMPNANYSTICTGAYYPSSHTNVGAEDSLGTTQLNTVYQAHVYSSVNTWFLNVLIVG